MAVPRTMPSVMNASLFRHGAWACGVAIALSGCGLFDAVKEQVRPPEAPMDGTLGGAETLTEQTPAVRAYRKAGAGQIYKSYPKRIYKGKLPPLVYAVAVVETHLDADGRVTRVTFSRTPSQAPEVPGEIEKLIKDASPLPAPPPAIGAHTYVDTWLWDKSGRFQLDTLTEGQRSR